MSCADVFYIPLQSGVMWPCKARMSSRARRIRLSIAPEGNTEIVFPQESLDREQLEDVLTRWQPWLNKACNKLFSPDQQERLAHKLAHMYTGALEELDILPERIFLPMIDEAWHVEYVPCVSGGESSGSRLRQSASGGPTGGSTGGVSGTLYVEGTLYECCELLQTWLRGRARPVLTERVRALASDLHLQVNKVRIGSQRGRWGSCSCRANINLNCRLLLLPVHLAEHVLYHELCHLTHLNHSSEYRALLASVAPQWKAHEKALDEAWRSLPEWSTLHCPRP